VRYPSAKIQVSIVAGIVQEPKNVCVVSSQTEKHPAGTHQHAKRAKYREVYDPRADTEQSNSYDFALEDLRDVFPLDRGCERIA